MMERWRWSASHPTITSPSFLVVLRKKAARSRSRSCWAPIPPSCLRPASISASATTSSNAAGSLLGRPVEVVPAKTVDLMVPADAEIVLEGRIDARETIEEGFVSEYHGMYEKYGPG